MSTRCFHVPYQTFLLVCYQMHFSDSRGKGFSRTRNTLALVSVQNRNVFVSKSFSWVPLLAAPPGNISASLISVHSLLAVFLSASTSLFLQPHVRLHLHHRDSPLPMKLWRNLHLLVFMVPPPRPPPPLISSPIFFLFLIFAPSPLALT